MKTIWKLSLLWLLFLTAPIQAAPLNFFVNPDYSPYTRSNPAAWRVWLLLTDASATNTGLLSSNDWARFNTEAASRIAADAALSNNVATVQTNVTAEVANRLAADSSLTNLVASEATARDTSDVNLTNSITSEASTRSTADTALQTGINGKQPLIALGTPGQIYGMTATTQAAFMTVVLGGTGTNTMIGSWPVILSTNTNGITITIQQAGPGSGGYLAASDWTNFNSSASVTSGYLAKGTGSNLTASAIYESGGNVGVGTNVPFADAAIHARIDRNGTTTLRVENGATNASASSAIILMTKDSRGSVGVNNYDYNAVSGWSGATVLYSNPTTNNTGVRIAGRSTNATVRIYTGGDGDSFERMRIDEYGKIGLMTISPTNTLDVNGNISSRSNIFAPNIYQGANRVLDQGYSNTVDSSYLKLTGGTLSGALTVNALATISTLTLGATNANSYMTFANVGGSGLGPGLYFQRGGNNFGWLGSEARFAGTASPDMMIGGYGGVGLKLYSGAVPALTIDLSQNVGIGKTNPATALDVNGTTTTTGLTIGTNSLALSANTKTNGQVCVWSTNSNSWINTGLTTNDIYGLLAMRTNLDDIISRLATIANVTTASNGVVTYVNSGLSGKSNTGHGHAESDVSGLVTDLAGKEPTVSGDGVAYHFWGGDKAWHNTDYSHITGTPPGAGVYQPVFTGKNVTYTSILTFISPTYTSINGTNVVTGFSQSGVTQTYVNGVLQP